MLLWAVQIILAALLTPVLTRLLGPSRFGVVAAGVAIMQLLFAIGSFGMSVAIQRAFTEPDGDERARRLTAVSIVIAAVTVALAYGTGSLWCPLIGLGPFPAAIRYAVLWSGLSVITNTCLALIRSRNQLGVFALVVLLQSIVAEAVALGLVVIVHRTAAEYLLGQMVCQAAAAAAAVWACRPLLPAPRDRPMLAGALRYASALVPAMVAGFVIDASDRLVIQADLGTRAVARYSVASNIGGLTLVLLWVLNSAWLPRLYAIKDAVVRRSVLTASRNGLYALVALVALGLTLAAPVLLSIWMPANYHPHGLVLVTMVIAASAVPVAGGQAYSRALLVHDRSVPVAVAAVIAAAANFGLNLALVPVLGIDGSALVTFVSYSVQLVLLRFWAQRVVRLPLPPIRVLVLVLLALGVALASTALPWTVATVVGRLGLAVVIGAVFLAQLTSVLAPQRLPALQGRLRWLRLEVFEGDEASIEAMLDP
jgi:O-antigen/teichoic acid export membrane protein